MAEFEPIEGGALDSEYRASLLERNVMPTAVVRITDQESRLVYGVFNRYQGRLVGLPVFDLADVGRREKVEYYVRRRLLHRFGLAIPKDALRLAPLESKPTDPIERMTNPKVTEPHSRRYYPVVGETGLQPTETERPSFLKLVLPGDILDAAAFPLGGANVQQFLQ